MRPPALLISSASSYPLYYQGLESTRLWHEVLRHFATPTAKFHTRPLQKRTTTLRTGMTEESGEILRKRCRRARLGRMVSWEGNGRGNLERLRNWHRPCKRRKATRLVASPNLVMQMDPFSFLTPSLHRH